jgi:hypothetical protein
VAIVIGQGLEARLASGEVERWLQVNSDLDLSQEGIVDLGRFLRSCLPPRKYEAADA